MRHWPAYWFIFCALLYCLGVAWASAGELPDPAQSENGQNSPQNTNESSLNSTSKWDSLESALQTLSAEAALSSQDSIVLLSELQALRTETSELKRSSEESLRLYENSERLRKAELEIAQQRIDEESARADTEAKKKTAWMIGGLSGWLVSIALFLALIFGG
jgi:hypothetical protein